MKIAFLGSRGIPARYSGFETFYEQLSTRLVRRGHAVTVYNRSHFVQDVYAEYEGVRLVSLPCIATKHLETITHTFLSTLHALLQHYDVAYYSIVGNAPLAWLPRMVGARTLLNVDGADWEREKWHGFAKWYQKQCERIATYTPSVIIADSPIIQARYQELYRKNSVYVPYGANTERDEGTDHLEEWDLTSGEYVLYVGRFVPENAIDLLIDAFKKVRTDKQLVIVGDAPYSAEYKERLHALADSRTVFTGYAFGETYRQLSSHAYLYVQPSGIEGTRPALLDQMGFGNCVLVRDGQANTQVIGNAGISFAGAKAPDSLTETLQQLIDDPAMVESMRERARMRIQDYYSWEMVTSFYEHLFTCLVDRRNPISYDEFLGKRRI